MFLDVGICQNTVLAWRIVGFAIMILKILVPIIIIVTSVMPLFSALVKGTADETVKSWQQIARKIAAAVIIFLVPSLVVAAVNLFAKPAKSDDIKICMECFDKPGSDDCQRYVDVYKKIEEESIDIDEDPISGSADTSDMSDASSDNNSKNANNGVSGTNNATVDNLLKQAKLVTDYVRENNFNYGDAPLNPAMNHDAKLVSCDRCVGWFLYNVGYTDQPYQSGLVLGTLQSYCESHGFTKITNVNQIQPGDIMFVNPNASGNPGHTYLLGNNIGNGIWERYDCGSVYRIRLTNQYSSYSSQPFHEPIGSFLYAYRMPNA